MIKLFLGALMVRANYLLGGLSLPVANAIMCILNRGVKFRKCPEIGDDVYSVTERAAVSRHTIQYFHLVERIHCYYRGAKRRGEVFASEYGLTQIKFCSGDIILDIGANSGDILKFFDDLGLDLHIFCFEPDPQAFAALSANAAARSGVVAIQKALGSATEDRTFYLSPRGGDSSLSLPPNYDKEITVKVLALDDWFEDQKLGSNKEFRIKLIKLEAEGFEPEILEGAISVLEKVDYIAADLGWERGPEQQCTIPEVVNCLSDNGFRVKRVARDGVHYLFENIGARKRCCQAGSGVSK